MSYCGATIFSENLSGLTTEVTFRPCSGGTISLGTQVFPFTYVNDYYFGTYDCYVPLYDYVYTLEIPCPSPTPTPTSTTTPTVTPTETPTITETPTETPTPTNTETTTQTPTPTNTETPTQTPTNTQTMTPTHNRFEFTVFTGLTSIDACSQVNTPTTIYGDDSLFDENIQFYNDSFGPVTIDMESFYNYDQVVVELFTDGAVNSVFTLCP
jgi:hypothetical protein